MVGVMSTKNMPDSNADMEKMKKYIRSKIGLKNCLNLMNMDIHLFHMRLY